MKQVKFYHKQFGEAKVEITKEQFIKDNEKFYKVGRLDRAIQRMKKTLLFSHPSGFYAVVQSQPKQKIQKKYSPVEILKGLRYRRNLAKKQSR